MSYETQLPEKLPDPKGWNILVCPIEIKSTTAGGIELPAETQDAMGYLRTVAQVVKMGPLCYRHPKFLDGEPWCKPGDWVRVHQYTGRKELVKGHDGKPMEMRYVFDDEVISTSDSPDLWVQEL